MAFTIHSTRLLIEKKEKMAEKNKSGKLTGEKDYKLKIILYGIIPLLLLAGLLWIFAVHGPLGIFSADLPPVTKLAFTKTILEKDLIKITVINDGAYKITIAQVLVNDAYNTFYIHSSNNPIPILQPLEKTELIIPYHWSEGNPLLITIIDSTGVLYNHEIAVASLTPMINKIYVKTFILIGLYVGILPVLLGLLWLPFLKRLSLSWNNFFLSITLGILLFLGFDTFAESLELIEKVPNAFQGVGLLVIGIILPLLILFTYKEQNKAHMVHHKRGFLQLLQKNKALMLSYMIAIGIGIHNLGEGLAIGSLYATGEVNLGFLLIIGFMIHNTTEGIAIAAPLAKGYTTMKSSIKHLLLLALIAGGPTIIGTLIGGFSYSPAITLFFLAIGIGAIFQVVFEVGMYLFKITDHHLFTLKNSIGFLLGLVIMYCTGLLVL